MNKKLIERVEPVKVIDLTGGRKPGKGEEISTLQIEGDNVSYRVIGNKLKRQKPSKFKDPGYLGWDMLFGTGQGPGYYFVNKN